MKMPYYPPLSADEKPAKHFCKNITVFAGSADGLDPVYAWAARLLGQILAEQGRTLVYGGGRTGLMGAIADSALQHGGEVIGVVNEDLDLPNLSYSGLTRLECVPNIQMRKARLIELADAFIALPGGFGTLDEVFETLTYGQLAYHAKGLGFLDTVGFYQPLRKMLDYTLAENFIRPFHRDLYHMEENPYRLLYKLDNYTQPENLKSWLERQ